MESICGRRSDPIEKGMNSNMTDNKIIKREHAWMKDPSNSRFLFRRHPWLGVVLLLTAAVLLVIQYQYWWRFTPAEINEKNFPDELFREYVQRFDADRDGTLGRAELKAVTEIEIADEIDSSDKFNVKVIRSVTSLKGIEYFLNLESLFCDGCEDLHQLDLSKNRSLKELACIRTGVTTLDVSHNKELTTLAFTNVSSSIFERGNLTELDVSKNKKLEYLWCAAERLTTLDVSKNKALTTLNCADNYLTELDVSRNKALQELDCGGNQLAAIDVSKNPNLSTLDCSENQLTSIDVSRNSHLSMLECEKNQLTVIDVGQNPELLKLFCNENRLTSIDVSQNTVLETLYCGHNAIDELDVSRNVQLVNLDCDYTLLRELDVKQNPKLEDLSCEYIGLSKLDISENSNLEYLSYRGNKFRTIVVNKHPYMKRILCDDPSMVMGANRNCKVLTMTEYEKKEAAEESASTT